MPLPALPRPSRPALARAALFAAPWLAYCLIFGAFYPNRQNAIGHDYALELPMLLDGYFWHRGNPLWAVPWFTPSFCGGVPAFGDTANIYYSLPMFLGFYLEPLDAVRLSVFGMAGLGYWGMFRLLRGPFGLGEAAAWVGAAVFLFNGFYAHRMIVGHLAYQTFMLLPWAAFFLLAGPPRPAGLPGWARQALYPALAGAVAALQLQGAFASLMLPGGVAVLALACLHLARHGGWRVFGLRSALALAVAVGLSASKLAAGQAFLAAFPRSDYLLPGIDGLAGAAGLLLKALFRAPANIAEQAAPRLANVQWALERHEWEYGVGPVPLLLIALYGASRLRRGGWRRPEPGRLAALALLGLALLLPLALNTYHPAWNALLKRLPLLKNSSNLLRWWLVYIPFLAACAALAFEHTPWLQRRRTGAALAAVLAVAGPSALADRDYYHRESYDPGPITRAFAKTRAGEFEPGIFSIGAYVDPQGQTLLPANRNDTLAEGVSQLACYNPNFGYQLEKFPLKTLHPGNVFQEKDGRLNLKNPACYLFPRENHCQPGDHFLAGQIEEAETFVRYRPYPFAVPKTQAAADAASWLSLAALAALLGWAGAAPALAKWRARRPS